MTKARDTGEVLNTRGTAATKDVGLAPENVPTNSDLPTFGTAAESNTGTASGQIPTADDLNMVGQTVNYTGANYQPTTVWGVGVVRTMKNASGGNISTGQQVAGDLLYSYYIAAGVSTQWVQGLAPQVWRCLAEGSTIGNGNGCLFVRVS